MTKEIVIGIDTREKKPWNFHTETDKRSNYQTQITGSEIVTLDAGDYTIIGKESLVRIERKAGFSELFGNMIPKSNKERFEREMEKFACVKHKYILIESYLNNDILGLSVGQMRFSPPSSKVLEWLLELEIKYNVHVLFVGDAGVKVCRKIFEVVMKSE